MKILKKAATLLMIVLLLSAQVSTVLAVSDTGIEPGKTATLTFEFKDVFNVDGTFTVNDTDGIVSKYTISVTNAGATAAVVNGDRLWAAPSAEPVKTDVSVAVKVTVKNDAEVAKNCTVSFAGVYGDGNGKPGNEKDIYQSATVTVKKAETPAVDYTELKKQIGIAEGLENTGNTTESWNKLTSALTAGKAALTSTSQATVDAAAKALKDAIAALVKVDYTELKKQIGIADGLKNTGYAAADWNNLTSALTAGKAALTSTSQAAVDAAAKTLKNAIASLVKVDYSELNKQVTIAKGLKSAGYTTESWNKLTSALTAGKAALTSTSQDAVDAAAITLKNAIATLVKVDYSKLQAAIKSVEQFNASEELTDLLSQLTGAVNTGKNLLTSGEQDAVDAAADRINGILEEIKNALNNKEPQTVIKEVEVEVLPTDDYCNMRSHRIWPILFFVSLGLNMVLVAIVDMMAAKKKKNAKDDTPLVDYDIGDDA